MSTEFLPTAFNYYPLVVLMYIRGVAFPFLEKMENVICINILIKLAST